MALDDNYIVGVNLGEYFVDKDTGEPLTGGTIEFWRDTDRLTPKSAYQLTGSPGSYAYVALPNPMTLSAVGTPENASNDNVAIYFYPFDANGDVDNYYIVVKDSSGDVQFTRQAWPNITDGNAPDGSANGVVTNELGNPQFVDVWFNPASSYTHTLTAVSEDVEIAPDWTLELTGSINSTVAVQRIALAGNLQAPQSPSGAQVANPPYALQLTPGAGITSIILRQRLNNNPGLFTGSADAPSYLSAYLIAKSETSDGSTVTMSLRESSGGTTSLGSVTLLTSGFSQLRNSVGLTASSNTQDGDTGYVDILVTVPINQTTRVSCVQVVAMDGDDTPAQYDREPVNRQEDHTWHNYKESVIIQPKDTVLTGWQFGLNPWQFTTKSFTTVASQAAYTADQSIVYQKTSANNIAVGTTSGSSAINQPYGVQAVTNTNQFALIQYIDKESCRPYWGRTLSSLVRCVLNTIHGTTIRFKMRLIYRSDAPPTIGAGEPIASWAATDPTFSAGWTAIEPAIDQVYTMENDWAEFPFDKFTLPSAVSGGDYLGVVVYTIDTMNSAATADSIYFDNISLVPNEFAIASNPKTFDQTLQECQFYYQKSYAADVLPGTSSAGGALFAEMLGDYSLGNSRVILRSFGFEFKNICRTTGPTLTFYSPIDGASGNVRLYKRNNGASVSDANIAITNWTQLFLSSTATSYAANTVAAQQSSSTSDSFPEGFIRYHYTCDSRLGLVP